MSNRLNLAASPFSKKSIGNSTQRHKKVLRLITIHKSRCYYCKVHCIDTINRIIPNKATVEHVYHGWDIRRGVSDEVVLACYKCNHDKGVEDVKKLFDGFDYRAEYPLIDLYKKSLTT